MPSEDGDLSFLDGPKLELDVLIDRLVESAQGVKRAQDRLRGLLRANELISGHLNLVDVLRYIVQAACDLADAKYGALGVIASDGSLEQFIHVGIADELAAEIGALPQGKGLLGALINDPKPIRLEDMGADPRSVGFPDRHPPMESFLGVPIRVGDDVFGNLYLTGSSRGKFSADDEELMRSLAGTAGTAISNARLYAESQRRQRWLAASAEIGAQLLADSGEDPLRMVARNAQEIADADLVAIVLVTPDGESGMVEVAIGDGAEELVARQRQLTHMLVGQVIRNATPIQLRSLAEGGDLGTIDLLPGQPVIDVGPLMLLPLTGSADTRGALVIVRRAGRSVFTGADLEMVGGFASHASIALELSAARSDRQRIALLEDRDRIARDLHDHVIQQLFAVGLSIEGTAALVSPDHAQRLRDQVADIDRTIRQIRTSIFELRGALGGMSGATRQRVLEIVGELTVVLGFAPQVVFSGQVDLTVVGDLADDVVAVIREALTNVARHAHASAVVTDVTVSSGEVELTISDNGIGISEPSRVSGLENLRKRAERRGGSFDVTKAPTGGTRLTWKAPAA
ncbi:MAG TPA: GAF domain-containing protein [Jatrophihabitans sp.]|jgi:signal transduction histidine kinase